MEWSALLKLGWLIAPILVAIVVTRVTRMTRRKPDGDAPFRPMLWCISLGLLFVGAFVLLMTTLLGDPPVWEILGAMAATYKVVDTFT